jgi:choline dehydrogenase
MMKYDHIVLGAGSAGAILAARLSEDPVRSVLLIEAGPDYTSLDTQPDELKYGYATGTEITTASHNWDFVGRGTATATSIPIPRGKVTGGSSAINGQVFLRGVPEDYNLWAQWGNDEWAFESCVDAFKRLEADLDFGDQDHHGADGPIRAHRFKREAWLPDQVAFHRACMDAGFADVPDHNDPNATGVGPIPMNNPDGIRWSTALGYLNPARHRLNLTIRHSCHIQRLLFEGTRCVGVEVESGGERFTVYGEEIILSAGAVGSPQILMLSGVGPRGHLTELGIPLVHDLPGVGQNLRDHPMIFVSYSVRDDYPQDPYAPHIQLMLRWTAEGSHLWNDLLMFMSSFASDPPERGGHWSISTGIRVNVVLNLALSAGELRLQSTDPNAKPLLDYRFMEDEFDRRRMREMIRLAARLFEHPAFAEIVTRRNEPTDAELADDDLLDAFVARDITTGQHTSGTCKMGPSSDPLAVVDQYGKVHGLQGLRVVDASIVPDCPRANTNVTTMMIGERVADFIKAGK